MNEVYFDSVNLVQIIDRFDFVRYTVALFVSKESKCVVKVKEYNPQEFLPKLIIREEYATIDDAKIAFEKLKEDYTAIVRIINKEDVSGREIFDDVIDYHLNIPKCCANCMFSRRDHRMFMHPRWIHLLCANEHNIKTYNRMLEEHRMCHKQPKTTTYLHPAVNDFGICKNYQECEDKTDKMTADIEKLETFQDEDWMRFIKNKMDYEKHNPFKEFEAIKVD